jgi:hypothetical protein
MDRRKRAMYGLPDHGPSPIRLLVESHGLTLDQLRAAPVAELVLWDRFGWVMAGRCWRW